MMLLRELFYAKATLARIREEKRVAYETLKVLREEHDKERTAFEAETRAAYEIIDKLGEDIKRLSMNTDQLRELQHKTINDARKRAEGLTKILIMDKLKNAHRLSKEIITDAQLTADKIMAGAESYAEAMRP